MISSVTPPKTAKYGYVLNYDWKHPWPRAPIPSHEDDRLAELYRYQILESESDEKFDKLCRIACKEMKCPIAAISFIDKQKQWFKANSGLTQKQIPRDVALCAHTIMHPKRPLIVEDTSLDERFKHNPLVTRASAVRFYAGVPITTASGYCIGSVFVFDVKVHQSVDAKILLKIAAKVLKYMEERLKGLKSQSAPKLRQENEQIPKVARPIQSNEQTAGEATWREKNEVRKEENIVVQKRNENTSTAICDGAPSDNSALTAPSTAVEVGGQGLGNMGTMLMNLLARTTETQQQLAAQQGVMFETLGQHSQQLDALGHSMMKLEERFEQVRLKQQGHKK